MSVSKQLRTYPLLRWWQLGALYWFIYWFISLYGPITRMKYLVKRVHLWNVNSFKAQRNCISKCRILSAHNIYVHAKSNLHNDKELKMKKLFKPFKAINKVIVQKLMLADIFLSFSSSLRAEPYFRVTGHALLRPQKDLIRVGERFSRGLAPDPWQTFCWFALLKSLKAS